jgi:hypothetical protein
VEKRVILSSRGVISGSLPLILSVDCSHIAYLFVVIVDGVDDLLKRIDLHWLI